ncbi:hypothetical protein GCM10011497_37850 [Elstera cyanobacteriorum]|uniref:DUF1640 domain-containing protein n=1 Tax=Elstera cyanobacteriorum TaxID=2022747 RepID=A0A255Y045_9PROT|nr:hypothetical protein [Elstera cyanobacteriorum]OYQ22014.1 hypothetical protein CHR90_00830 [Elstera cyanobacteriorum]GGA04007.1 hypothetical protein GCM10011497_37850 [Elstera cyanobacteriorum]
MSASAILKLQTVGFTNEQVTALADLIDTQAATKADLEGSEHRLELKMAKIDADVVVLKWMMGFVLAFQVAIFARMFLKA